ncbi:DUF308 domain-containing protein [Agrilactobacillus fermenti]|uniref:DUF308 domain-containing protein n=1 Tax=Agrilactobacillus fermenti TaxID=2586909 RepID=UPI003A5C2F49
MNKFFDSMRHVTWLKSIAYIILGLFSLFEPKSALNIFINVAALFVAVFGIINLINGLRHRAQVSGMNTQLTVGILQLLAAGLILILTKPILSALPFMLGIGLGIAGVTQIGNALSSKQYVNVVRWPWLLYGALILIIGLILLFNPFNTVLLTLRIFGAALVVMAIMEIVRGRKLTD